MGYSRGNYGLEGGSLHVQTSNFSTQMIVKWDHPSLEKFKFEANQSGASLLRA